MKIKPKGFKTRKALDAFIHREHRGNSSTTTIEGTTEELNRLHLKDGQLVYGIKVKDTSVKDTNKKTFINTKALR